MKFLTFLSLIIISTQLTFAQPGYIKKYDRDTVGFGFLSCTIENDTIITYSNGFDESSQRGIRFFKIDKEGNILKSTFVFDSIAILTTEKFYLGVPLKSTFDSGYLLFGSYFILDSAKINIVSLGAYTVKLNHNLEVEYIEKYDSPKIFFGSSICETKNAFYILGRYRYTWGHVLDYASDIVLLKTDKKGKEIWRKVYAKTKEKSLDRGILEKIDDNTFVLDISEFVLYDSLSSKYSQVIIDSTGESKFQDTLLLKTWLHKKVVLDDSSIISANFTYKYETKHDDFVAQPSISRVDKSYNPIWKKDLSYAGKAFNYFYAIEQLHDGNFIASGSTWDNAYMYKFDKYGNKIWSRYDKISKNGTDLITSTGLLSNGDIIACGAVKDNYAFLMKVTSDGCLDWTDCPDWVGIEHFPENDLTINISPNPTSDFAIFSKVNETQQKAVIIKIYNMIGTHIQDLKIDKFEQNTYWHTQNVASGIYFCQILVDEQIISTERIIVQ